MTYNTVAIRELLKVIFDDQELVIFCYDHFRPVYDKFATETSRLWKIQLLVDYCERYGQFDKLLTQLREINPQQYAKFIVSIKSPSRIPNPSINSSKSKVEVTLQGNLSNLTPELLFAVVGALAGVLNIPRDQINVLQTRGGSIILQLEMPGEAVNQLLVLYKVKNPIIQELGIQQVRMIHPNRESAMTMPSQIDRYEIIGELGKGGMGRVYKARDPYLGGRVVALKTIILPGTGADEALHDRFKKEVAAAGRLNHDHIVTIYNVKFDYDPPYMVMEFLDGGTLRQQLDQAKSLPWEKTLTLLRPMVLALDYAHKAGVIHRDIKPENMMFKLETSSGRGGVLKLVDFGLAHWDEGPALTRRGDVMGTPRYMSPEQARGEDVDAKTDIFALGVILYEILSGFNPLERGNTMATLREAGSDQPLDLNPLTDKIPPGVLDLVRQAVTKDPEQRYQTCERLLLDWDACLRSAVVDNTVISSAPPPLASPVGVLPPVPPDNLPPFSAAPEGDEDNEGKPDQPNVTPPPESDDEDEPDHPDIIPAPGLDLPADDLKILKYMFANWERVPDRVIVENKFHAGFTSRVYLTKLIRKNVPPHYLVVKIAPVGSIEKEWAVYNDCIKDFFIKIVVIRGQPVYPTGILAGGLCYELEGGGTFPFESLLTFCQHQETKVDDILFVLNEQLFKIIETVGKHGQLDSGFLMHNSYDRLLPVNLEVKPTPPPSGATVITIKKAAPSVSVKQGEYVSLEKFIVTEVDRERNEVTLNLPASNYNPCADDPPHSYRVRLKEVQTIEDFQENNIAPPIKGVVTASRADLLQGWAQRAGVNTDLTATRLPLSNQASLSNPIPALPDLLRPRPAKVGIVHGDLNVENILIELPARTVGLIDFADARRDHVLHDLLRLETGLLTRWLPQLLYQTGQLSPEKIYDFLARVDQKLRYPSRRIDAPRGLEKPFAALIAIRQAALDHFLVKQEQDWWSEYYRGLTLYLLGALKFKNLDDVPQAKLVAFWAAATACEFIENSHEDDKKKFVMSPLLTRVVGVILLVILVGAGVIWLFMSRVIIIDDIQVVLDENTIFVDGAEVACGELHHLQVAKLLKDNGEEIDRNSFSYQWQFASGDSKSNFAINFEVPCDESSKRNQMVTIEVQQTGQTRYRRSITFNITQ